MALESAVGYLVALALPLWLLVEQVMYWRRPEKQVKSARLSDVPASRAAARVTRARAMTPAHARKAA